MAIIMQKNLIPLVFSVLIVSLFTADAMTMGHGRVKREATWQCKGKAVKAADELVEGMTKCKNPKCQEACMYEDVLKIVVDGKLDNDLMTKWIEKMYPDFVVEQAKEEWGKCLKRVPGKLSKDNACKSYEGLKQCAVAVTENVCG